MEFIIQLWASLSKHRDRLESAAATHVKLECDTETKMLGKLDFKILTVANEPDKNGVLLGYVRLSPSDIHKLSSALNLLDQ